MSVNFGRVIAVKRYCVAVGLTLEHGEGKIWIGQPTGFIICYTHLFISPLGSFKVRCKAIAGLPALLKHGVMM